MDLQIFATISLLLLVGVGTAENDPILCNPPYEEYNSCGTACPPTCQKRLPQKCTLQCVEGCFCRKGYIREGPGGRCVPETCESTPICNKKFETFSNCGSLCPRICNATVSRICPAVCVTGCVCEAGYLRDKLGNCVPEASCRIPCEENEAYNECGTSCPGTCSQPIKVCDRRCVKGCFCKVGYVLHDTTRKCIQKEECSGN